MTTPARLPLLAALVAVMSCADRPQRTAALHEPAHEIEPTGFSSPQAHPLPGAMQRLAAVDSSVTWEPQSVLVADIDCDGTPDSVLVGRSSSRVAVGVVRAAAPTPEIISFGTHGSMVEDEVGSKDAQLAVESLDYDPGDAGAGDIEGFQRSAVCKGLNLGDGETDSMHIFWNSKSHHLDWWRL